MKTNFTEKINKHAPVIGTLVTLEAPEVAEMLSLCGFEWLFIDMEHGTLSTTAIQHVIQAIKGDCSALVRVPENRAVWIKKALDTGCDGIIVPLINSPDAARQAVMAAKYPPMGARSVGIGRAHEYGMSFADYLASANDRVALIIQIEHIDAVTNLDDILNVSGIDGVLIGPYDLSGSMNMLGNIASEPVQAAISRIKDQCQKKSIPVGIFVLRAEAAQKEIDDGCKFIAVGIDTSYLWNGAKNALSIVKGPAI